MTGLYWQTEDVWQIACEMAKEHNDHLPTREEVYNFVFYDVPLKSNHPTETEKQLTELEQAEKDFVLLAKKITKLKRKAKNVIPP